MSNWDRLKDWVSSKGSSKAPPRSAASSAAANSTNVIPVEGRVVDSKKKILEELIRECVKCASGKDGTQGIAGLAIAYCGGDVRDLARCCTVSKAWQRLFSSKLLWKWCIRWGNVPPSVRPQLWLRCANAGGPLGNDLYTKLVAEGRGTKWADDIIIDVSRSSRNCPDLRRSNPDVLDPQSDISSRCPTLGVYRVLLATAAVDAGEEGVGYVQGMNYVVQGMISCSRDGGNPPHIAEEQSFSLFNSVLHTFGLNDMYKPGMKALQMRCLQFASLTKVFLPVLCTHFVQCNVILEVFSLAWLQTGFFYFDAMPDSTRRKVWDIFLFEKDWKIFFRVALAVLKLIEPELLILDLDGIMKHLQKYPDAESRLSPKNVVKTALDMKVTRSLLLAIWQYWEERV